jgi:hypothetical protein
MLGRFSQVFHFQNLRRFFNFNICVGFSTSTFKAGSVCLVSKHTNLIFSSQGDGRLVLGPAFVLAFILDSCYGDSYDLVQ